MKTTITLISSFIFLCIQPSLPQSIHSDTLNVNNIAARINCDGTLFSSEDGSASIYQVPKGGDLGTMFTMSLWMGALDINGQFHLASRTGMNSDFQPGPVSSDYSGSFAADWNKVWKIDKYQIEYHKDHWMQSGYVPIPVIATWPGNGDTLNGQTPQIAPFVDLNNDGIYNPLQGDYPLISGDQAVFFVFNDDVGPPSIPDALNLKAEIRGMAYSFNCPEDSALMYTTFYHYDIVNRSTTSYSNCIIGVFGETDLGCALDDYIGSDVSRSSFYAYNGKNFDGFPLDPGYGLYPPVQAVTILAGPFMPPDGIDNPAYDTVTMNNCGNAVNGTNFGDNFADNERLGLTGFYTFYNTSSGPMHYPQTAGDYLHYLGGQWLDGVHFSYANAGYNTFGPTVPECNFVFPYDSDPCNWGTMGIEPPAYSTGAGGSGPFWTMPQAGLVPADARGLGVSGPFNLNPGSTQFLDIALVTGRNYSDTNAFAGLYVVRERIDLVRSYFSQGLTPCGNWVVGIDKEIPKVYPGISIYPNPAKNTFTIDCQALGTDLSFSIVNLLGLEVNKGSATDNNKTTVNVADLPSGVYFVRFNNKVIRKIIVNR